MRGLLRRTPASTEDMCVESNFVSLISDEDGDNTIVERLSFTRIQITTESNGMINSPFRKPLVRQDASNPIVLLIRTVWAKASHLTRRIRRGIRFAGLALS